ncbi:MAG: hypothetical protein C5S49_07825 [Candidatus Methanogaster sp.]|nr:MAG: hypothetical protein C5S49_07825 [ANME-2 cluster archaeon]
MDRRSGRSWLVGVHDGAGFRLRGLHKSVKEVGVDLLMVNSQRKYITDDEGLAFARVGFLFVIGLATGEERSLGMAAGSILSIGLQTRFWIMRTRRECMALFGRGGAHLGGALW